MRPFCEEAGKSFDIVSTMAERVTSAYEDPVSYTHLTLPTTSRV